MLGDDMKSVRLSSRARRLLGSAAIGTLTALLPPAIAQEAAPADQSADEGVEEVVVTARKTKEKLQEVPASISVVSSKDIADAGLNEFKDILAQVPNVAFGGGIASSIQGQIGIRGISTLVRNIGVESSVGFYVDGVYLGRPENYNQELIDVDRVEVLRGPQGTLFGKNTIAGVFNIATKMPGDETLGEVRLQVGNYGLTRVQGYAMGPLVPGVLAGKISGGYVARDGFYKHQSGGKDLDTLDVLSGRLQLVYTPGDNTTVVFSADGLRDRGEPVFFQVADLAGVDSVMETTPFTVNNNRPDSLDRDNWGLSLSIEHDFGGTTLTSISAYRSSSYQASLDDDQEQVDFLSGDRWGDETTFFSQELRLAGSIGEKLTYIVGAYFFDQKITTDRILTIGADFGVPGDPALTTVGEVKSQSYALFGTLDYALTDALSLSVGLRYSSEDKDVWFIQDDRDGIFQFLGLPDVSYTASTSDDDLSPTVSLSWKADENVLLYGRIAKGFKSAAFNVDLVGSTAGLAAGPESATTYEVGVKSDLFDRKLRANLAVFTTNYDDMQVSQLLGGGVTLNNAGKATISGAELELVARITSGFTLQGSVGYLDAEYDEYLNCGIPLSLGGGSTDCSGNKVIGAPDWTTHLAAEYTHPLDFGELAMRIDWSTQSPVYYEATNSDRFKTDSRSVIDARIGLRTERYDVFLWAQNLTDEVYETYTDDRSAVAVLKTIAYGAPRTWGLTLTARF